MSVSKRLFPLVFDLSDLPESFADFAESNGAVVDKNEDGELIFCQWHPAKPCRIHRKPYRIFMDRDAHGQIASIFSMMYLDQILTSTYAEADAVGQKSEIIL